MNTPRMIIALNDSYVKTNLNFINSDEPISLRCLIV